MKKLLIICGPTATGKTKLAVNLARKFNGELVSADSRQVHKGLDSLTGKELPKNIKYPWPGRQGRQIANIKYKYKDKIYRFPTYEINGIKLWMYDVVGFHEEFSVAHYRALAQKVISDILERKKLPIVVGGTGLYLRALTQNLSLIHVPADFALRRSLCVRSITELQEELQRQDHEKWERMNQSDRANPRRLIRAIEIALWRRNHRTLPKERPIPPADALWIGLTAPLPVLRENIRLRVLARLDQGTLHEVKDLGIDTLPTAVPAPSTIGLSLLRSFLDKKIARHELIDRWIAAEFDYAKRQITWFQKQKEIQWFDTSSFDWTDKVEAFVGQWYTRTV